MRLYSCFLFFCLLLMQLSTAHAYVNFIGHGYNTCLTCHYNPFGGGLLNDYGRAVSATGISARDFYPSSFDEEKVAYLSGFLFRPPKQSRLRTQINYRSAEFIRNPGSKSGETKTWLPMQLDLRAKYSLNESETIFITGDIGKSPPPSGVELENDSKIRSRSHYLGYRPSTKLGIYLGLMDKPYGLRIAEHIAFSRTLTQNAQNDQTHGIATHYLMDTWEFGAHAFVGNLTQDSELRMQGGSFIIERSVLELSKIGFSAQKSNNKFIDLTTLSFHSKTGFGDGSSVMLELGQTQKKAKQISSDLISRYGLIQTHVRPRRGLYLLANIEYLKNDIESDEYLVRYGPGLQYFPIQRLEFRLDLYNTRTFLEAGVSKDSWAFLKQLHLWF